MPKPLPKRYRDIRRSLRTGKSIAGLGLFALEPIPRKKFIIEYFGPVLNYREANERGGKYLFETNRNRFVDGSSRANIARYINHSCEPNCEVEIFRGRIYVFSKKSIKAGEELFYDYGEEYFDEHIKPHGCRCRVCVGRKRGRR